MTEEQEKLKALEVLPHFQGLTINEPQAVLNWVSAYIHDYQKFDISSVFVSRPVGSRSCRGSE